MLLICFIYAILLGVIGAVRIIVNDPERDRIWRKEADLIIEQKNKEIAQLRAELAHYKRYRDYLAADEDLKRSTQTQDSISLT